MNDFNKCLGLIVEVSVNMFNLEIKVFFLLKKFGCIKNFFVIFLYDFEILLSIVE